MPDASHLSTSHTSTPLTLIYRPLADLRLDPGNPRTHSPKQVAQIARSIEAFGFNVPVLVDGTGKVIAGHGRILACRRLGLAEVPTIQLEHLSEAQARAFLIADNRLGEIATWDDRLLAEQLRALSELDLTFSLEATGFEMGEIDLCIESLASPPDDSTDAADAPLPPAGPAVSVAGDLWQLGRHRVLCGNALEAGSYTSLMQGETAAMVFSDPPYNVPIDGHAGGLGAIHHRAFAMASGEMSPPEFTTFLTKATRTMAEVSAAGALVYLCMDWRHMGELLAAGQACALDLQNLCVWAKDNAGMGSLYRSQHELVFVFRKGAASHRNNIQLGRFGRNRTNVWRYASPSAFGRTSEEGNLLALHPTVKPVALVADAILDCTERGDIVLDGFLGSGTTLMAAERVGRRCHGIELDPLYVDTVVRRWQAYTGDRAVHAVSGRPFDATEAA